MTKPLVFFVCLPLVKRCAFIASAATANTSLEPRNHAWYVSKHDQKIIIVIIIVKIKKKIIIIISSPLPPCPPPQADASIEAKAKKII